MTAEHFRHRIFEVVRRDWPIVASDEAQRSTEAWTVTDLILPIVLNAMAEQAEDDANVEPVVLRMDPWGKPYLVPRRDVIIERAKALRERAGTEGRI